MYQQSFNSDRFNTFKRKTPDVTNVFGTPQVTSSSAQLKTPLYGNQPTTYKPQPIQTLNTGQVKYDNNTTQGTPKFLTTTTTPPTPPPITDKKLPPPAPSSGTNYLSETNKIAQEEQKFLEDRAKSEETTANRIYDRKIQSAQDQAPLAQQAYDQFKNDTTTQATTDKGNVDEQWGNDQRLLAQTRRETAGRLGAKFASQNTSDSFGAGSSQQANTNLESDFNRQTAQGLQSKSNNFSFIDQKSSSLIAQEGIKLKQTLLTIQNTIYDSQEQKAGAIQKAYDDAKAGILGIRDNLANLKYQKALSDEQIAKTSETAGLSPEFIKTGTPQTAADFVFRMKNPTGFATYGTANTTTNGQNKVLDMVNKVLGGNTKAFTGFNQITIPGTSGAVAKADWEGIKSLLTLAARGQLKGQGQVSDMETRMLEKASAAGIDVNMPDDVFRQRLEALKQDLVAGGATVPSSSGGLIRVKDRSSGQTGTIPANEFDPSLYEQIS